MKKIILIVLSILSLYYVYNKNTDVKIPDSAIRFRILANSNSPRDQKIKEDIRNRVQEQLYSLLKDVEDIDTARMRINDNIGDIRKTLDNETKDLDYSYKIDYGMHKFPKKVYKGITYDEGMYESLLITLGEGRGDNWWCVLFPPLCVMEAESTNSNEVEYKSFIKETLKKYFLK